MKKPILSLIACAIAFSSCALEKQEITFPSVAGKPKEETAATAPAPTPTPLPSADDDGGFRLPDMYAMPDNEQLKSTTALPSGDGDGTVTAQPPRE
ncbi:MAG: hypothetical protein NWT08_04315 [Akkermansiaceae bacterium]|nr:hypothetical protein [Akkermansiaceae bacterium]MDP4646102.1 hypothetical protein [Akkermansiaceae bacterium]MDP4720901.1 hypothetical protein [Akkermansiaceae bacterium]MDP4780740.1 hypothetical protein [Akkermansiaceae bacterium]MDP4845686.1 hypothetical protein [Akkermansiaceae bacterium]